MEVCVSGAATLDCDGPITEPFCKELRQLARTGEDEILTIMEEAKGFDKVLDSLPSLWPKCHFLSLLAHLYQGWIVVTI